jgi:hypothetical protein
MLAAQRRLEITPPQIVETGAHLANFDIVLPSG